MFPTLIPKPMRAVLLTATIQLINWILIVEGWVRMTHSNHMAPVAILASSAKNSLDAPVSPPIKNLLQRPPEVSRPHTRQTA